jgi:hypothetical protein
VTEDSSPAPTQGARFRLAGSEGESRRNRGNVIAILAGQALIVVVQLVFAPTVDIWSDATWTPSAPGSGGARVALLLLGLLAVVAAIQFVIEAERMAERRVVRSAEDPGEETRRWYRHVSLGLWRRAAAYAGIGYGIAIVVSIALFACCTSPTTAHILAVTVLAGAVGSVAMWAGLCMIEKPAERSAFLAARTEETPGVERETAARPIVALSGGGIRAAAFALGAYNALQERPQRIDGHEPRLVAVSGGGYIAAATALVRSFAASITGCRPSPPEEPIGWTDAYAPDTPELTRLRRHTRDLKEPSRFLLQGVLALLAGAAVNIAMAVAVIRATAWLLGWLYSTTGILRASPGHVDLRLPWFGVPQVGWLVLVPAVPFACAVLLTIRILYIQRHADDGEPGGRDPSVPGRWRTNLVAGTVVALLALIGTPALLAGIADLGLSNAPNPTVASVVRVLGFTTPQLCADAARKHVSDASTALARDAQLNPEQTRHAEPGACGATIPLSATFPAPDGGTISDADRRQLIESSIRDQTETDAGDNASQIALLTAIVSAIGLLLRWFGRNADVGDLGGWVSKLRKLLLAWVPLTVVGLVGLWLFLMWTFRIAIGASGAELFWPGVLLLVAMLFAVWCDANALTLHAHYRQRLSSAFAVGIKPTGGADELDYTKIYNFSALQPPVDLNVVTTANVRAHDQTPTRRGGLPLVFTPGTTYLETADGRVQRVTRHYEDAVGTGRVSIMAAVATSGAAVSPMAGRFAAEVAPFRALLTLFNVRIGSWVVNPVWTAPGDKIAPLGLKTIPFWPVVPWLISRPGAAQVLAEAAGRASASGRWLYLSDGGHLDNTGLVEAVRLAKRARCRRGDKLIVAVDASNDIDGSWSAVGDALAVIRSDLHTEFVRVAAVADAERPHLEQDSWVRRVTRRRRPAAAAAGPVESIRIYREFTRGVERSESMTIVVVKAVRPTSLEGLPEPVRAFAATHPDFPRAATTRQDFGDIEFEAYRALGEFSTRKGLELHLRLAEARCDG